MKLEPVYLLAPEPEPPRVSRRAFLLAAIGGPLLGGALGYGLGRATSPDASQFAAEETAPPRSGSSDERLQWALRLLESPDEQLLAQATGFLSVANRHTENLSIRAGVVRLTRVVSERPEHARSRTVARLLIDWLDRIDPSARLVPRPDRQRLASIAR